MSLSDSNQDPYLPDQEHKSEYVHSMFDSIAQTYDLMNDLMTCFMHRIWKKEVCELLNIQPGNKVVDLCCGTGDLTSMIANKHKDSEVVGLDFSPEMLEVANHRSKLENMTFVQGDVLQLPFEDDSVDCVSISFGLRNVSDYTKCLQEIYRISKSNSNFVILDLSHPKGFWDIISRFYRFTVIPLIGKLIVQNQSAYGYLPNSIKTYPNQDLLVEMIKKVGWNGVEYKNYFGGIVAIHIAKKTL